ncbi:MAG: PEP-CTERM sorting domain-containing protein [Verrucomicrobiia bacterium]
MKINRFTKAFIAAITTIAAITGPSKIWAQTITFDDLNPTTLPGGDHPYNAQVPNGYAGLQWNNFFVTDVPQQLQAYPYDTGYANGLVSGNNEVYNAYGTPALISDGAFNLNSAYLTGAWNNGLQVEVQGFVGNTLTYDTTYTVNTTGPTLVNFNYLGVDKVNFISFGGVSAGYGGTGTQFVMDNMTISPVPEPSVLALVGLNAAALMICRWRKC